MPRGDIHPVHGALVRVEVDHPAYVKQDPNLAGELGIGVPRAERGWGVVDTGARLSCVSVEVANRLDLLEVDALEFRGVRAGHGPSADSPQFSRVRFGILRIEGARRAFSARLVEVRPLGRVNDEPIIVLLGRDVLSHGELRWDGPGGTFEVALRDDDPSPAAATVDLP